jgi:hypothetical protein
MVKGGRNLSDRKLIPQFQFVLGSSPNPAFFQNKLKLMLHSTKAALLSAILAYNKANGHNLESIQHNNPFPASPRWIGWLAHSVNNRTSRNFHKKVVLEMMDFLKLNYSENDDGFLVVNVCEN